MNDPVVIRDISEIGDRDISINERFESIVVLGASGMLGSYIVESLCLLSSRSPKKVSVTAVSRNPIGYLQILSTKFRDNLSYIGYEDLNEHLHSLRNVLVIHCASPASIQAIMKDASGAIFTNIELTTQICKTLSEVGGHVVFLSSGEVNGFDAPTPIKEDVYSGINHLVMRGIYPELKKAAETVISVYASSSRKISASILRVSHTFGPGLALEDPRIFGVVVNAIFRNEPIRLRSSGETMRTFMYSSDLLTAILQTSKLEGFNYFNVAGTGYMSVLEFCKIAESRYGTKCEISNSAENESTPRNPQDASIDTSKLLSLGWTPKVSIEDAISRTLASTKFRMQSL